MSKPLRVELAVVGTNVVMACTGKPPKEWRGGEKRAAVTDDLVVWVTIQGTLLEDLQVSIPNDGWIGTDSLICKSRRSAQKYFELAVTAVEQAMINMYGDEASECKHGHAYVEGVEK